MSTHADGWKDEEGDVNDFKVRTAECRPEDLGPRPKHSTATIWFDLKDVDDRDIMRIIEEVERAAGLYLGTCGVTVGS